MPSLTYKDLFGDKILNYTKYSLSVEFKVEDTHIPPTSHDLQKWNSSSDFVLIEHFKYNY